MHPTYYRGCWHVVSRCLFERYTHPKACSRSKAVYNPKAVIRTRRRCIRLAPIVQYSPTAASRRSLGRISVPMWPVALSGRLPVVGSVGRYPADYLIGRDPIPYRYNLSQPTMRKAGHPALPPFGAIPVYGAGRSRITHPFATLTTKQSLMDPVRLACVKHAASVHPEPESNPPQKNHGKTSNR